MCKERELTKDFTTRYGETNVHIMSECFDSIPIALGLRKGNPLEPLINAKIESLREGGLIGIVVYKTFFPFFFFKTLVFHQTSGFEMGASPRENSPPGNRARLETRVRSARLRWRDL